MRMNVLPILAVTAALICTGLAGPRTGFAGSLDLNIQLNGYLPAPPGVHIYYDSGRPYYMEDHRRVYLKKKEKEHHDHGRKLGHKKHHRD